MRLQARNSAYTICNTLVNTVYNVDSRHVPEDTPILEIDGGGVEVKAEVEELEL